MKKLTVLLVASAAALLVVAAWAAALPRQAYAQGAGPTATVVIEGTGPTPAPGAQYQGVQKCQACHAQQAETWAHAPHADAFKVQAFAEAWAAAKRPGYCLACHTTGYDANTGKYAFEGVTCESCHGPFVEGHPQQPMQVNSSPEACGVCHRSTLNEWQLSQHGINRIGCTSCHDAHGQTIKAGQAGELCIKCHADQADASMHAGGVGLELTCEDCHIGPRTGDPMEGHANTGHTFMVGTGTCSRCHADEIHRGVAAMMGAGTPTPVAGANSVATVAAQEPEAPAPAEAGSGLALPVIISGAAGLGLGGLLMGLRSRKSA